MTRRAAVIGATYLALMVGLAVLAAWPIYESWWFVLTAGLSAVFGAVVGIVSLRTKLSAWVVGVVLAGGSYALAVAFGVRDHWLGATIVSDGLRESALGFVTGWKDLITSPLPVGTYRNLLVPAIIVFVMAAFCAVRFAFADGRRAGLSVVALGALLLFGLVFGRTSVSSPFSLGSVTVTAPIEMGIGVIALIATMWWLSWRARDERRRAIARATKATGMRGASSSAGAHARRAGLAIAMVVVAVSAGAAVTPVLAENRTRDVIRSAVGPEVVIAQAKTPLADYRTNFTNDHLDDVLFSYTTAGEVPERIRLASMSVYDGESYRVQVDASNPYQRVPSRLDAGSGERSTVRIDVGTLSGIWVPTFGALESIQFQGADASQLSDGFYYNAASGTGVVVEGLEPGSTYVLTATEPRPIALEDAQAPGATPKLTPPESLITWLDEQNIASTGAGLAEVVQTLRDRGYLSHALLPPADNSQAEWMTRLDGYGGFQSSAAGHSLSRIDQLFSQMLERDSQTQGQGKLSRVAAIGDDEQFAVATALIAQQLGFPARVVVGVRTSGTELPACTGECRAADLAAWAEVQDQSGSWIPIDVTPQHTESLDVESRTQRDPENFTDVRPEDATEVAPPDPDQQESEDNPQPPTGVSDDAALGSVIRYVAIGALALILLIAPFLTILIAKVARRKERKAAPDVADRIAGGWEEYVDAAVDAGFNAPTIQTRTELAAEYETPAGLTLAVHADHAQFSNALMSDAESEQFWQVVEAERQALKKQNGWWRSAGAALSLKSFVRQLSVASPPSPRSRPRSAERGQRQKPRAQRSS